MTSASIRVLAEAAAEQDRNTEAWRLVFETPVSLASRVRAAATCKRMYQMLQLRPTNGAQHLEFSTEPLDAMTHAMRASRGELKTLGMTIDACVSYADSDIEGEGTDWEDAVVSMRGPFAVTLSSGWRDDFHLDSPADQASAIRAMAACLLRAAGVASLALPDMTLASTNTRFDEEFIAADIWESRVAILADPRVRVRNCTVDCHSMLTEQPDIDTAPAMLALAARPFGILTVVPGPVASATALLRNTLAPAVRVMCGAHESEMDDADGAAIAANLNIRSIEIHAESVSAVVAALGTPAHDFSDGVVIVNAQPARVTSTRPLVAPLNGLRVGTKLCVDVDVFQWRTSSFQALMHALARSPTVHHFGWTAVCFAKDMFNGEYKLLLPDHVTSARFRTGAKYMDNVFDDDSSFPGLVDLHVETTPSDALANFHGQNNAIKRILLAAPRLQRLVIDVNGTKAFLLRTVDTLVKCAPACLAHVSVAFDMVDRTADLRWKNEARDLISKGEGEGARAGVRWAIRVFENYAAFDELTMIT